MKAAVGYSGKPLAVKLGHKPGARVLTLGVPAALRGSLAGKDVTLVAAKRALPNGAFDASHIFVTERAKLAALLPELMKRIVPHGMIWVSWPKKAAKMVTDITEDTVRAVALPLGLVDVKVCAVDEVWSGLKLVIRKERR